MEVMVPPLHGVANAIGAALTRTTSHLSLTADTASGQALGADARHLPHDAAEATTWRTPSTRPKPCSPPTWNRRGWPSPPDEIQITQADAFNMVEGSYTTGKNIRVVAQVQPAVVARLDAAAPPSVPDQLLTGATFFRSTFSPHEVTPC